MFWEIEQEKKKSADLWRDPLSIQSREGSQISHSGRTWLDFSNNDALGLAQRQIQIEALSGVGASRLVTGNSCDLEQVEKSIADWLGFEACLLFPSGWQANISLLSGLFSKENLVLSDALNHASLVDGLRLSGCQKIVFPHRDLKALGRLLDEYKGRVSAIVVESLYSVDGDFFPLDDLLDLVAGTSILLIVDEAHAAGIYGSGYQGKIHSSQNNPNLIKVVTASKALGAQGALVCCTSELREYLMNACRGFIFSTGVSPILAQLISSNVQTIQQQSLGQEKLIELSCAFYDRLVSLGLSVCGDRGSHIVAVDFTNHQLGFAAKESLNKQGVWVAFLRYPTVAQGTSRLRFSLTVHHTQEHLDKVVGAFESWLKLNKV